MSLCDEAGTVDLSLYHLRSDNNLLGSGHRPVIGGWHAAGWAAGLVVLWWAFNEGRIWLVLGRAKRVRLQAWRDCRLRVPQRGRTIQRPRVGGRSARL